MKITSVTTTAVRMPIDRAPYPTEGAGTKIGWGRRSRLSPKRPEPMLEYVLVRIDTDESLTGIGESTVDIGFFGQTFEEVQAAIDDYLGPPHDAELALPLEDGCPPLPGGPGFGVERDEEHVEWCRLPIGG